MSEAAKRYAQALFALKQDRAGLAAGVKLVTDQPELYSALCNPTVSSSDKEAIVEKVFSRAKAALSGTDTALPATESTLPHGDTPSPGAESESLLSDAALSGADSAGKEKALPAKDTLVDTYTPLSESDEVFLHFFKLLCQNARMPQLPEIAREYDTLCLEQAGGIRARLVYAVKPGEAELERIKQAICKKYHKTSVAMQLEEDQTLLGGFVLYVGNTRYDNSLKTRLAGLQSSLQAR